MSLSRAPARDTSETPSPRERIRSHMKMVIDQLEGILKELKDVAKELRELCPTHHALLYVLAQLEVQGHSSQCTFSLVSRRSGPSARE
ncbi:UPF0583 protein [Lates japonicus]|uniref:Inhibitory synaptic factor 1 n=1 Tax=Lates japonicus TaxID=270547 RepID=A0AAD3MQT3_LATJO|nr:UPF0583 protein [Lates japonicus]